MAPQLCRDAEFELAGFRWLTEGLSIDQPKANKSIERCVFVRKSFPQKIRPFLQQTS